MSHDDQLNRRFEELRFSDEPPMASGPDDDARRGQGRLRRRRAVALTSGLAVVTVAATGVALALPSGPSSERPLQVAGEEPGGGTRERSTPTPPQPSTKPSVEPPGYEGDLDFPVTRQLLLDTAVEHLDPRGEHLPDESTGFNGGWVRGKNFDVGTKLDWTIPGEDGMGMVQVLVTTPDYVNVEEYAREGIAWKVGCGEELSNCTKQRLPGTSEEAWVAEPDPEQNLKLGVLYERSDGSLVGVGVYDLFGNNSTTPVYEVDVDLERASAFVTDPDLAVDPDEAAKDPSDGATGAWPPK